MFDTIRKQPSWKFFAMLSVFNACMIPFSIVNLQSVQADVAQQRLDRIKVVNATLRFECEENNRQDSVLSGLLRASVQNRDPSEPPLSDRERVLYASAMKQLKTKDCNDLPVINGNGKEQGIVR